MKQLTAFQIFEFKRFPKKRFRLITAIILVVLSLLFVHIGAVKFKQLQQQKIEFQELEKLKVTMYVTYTQYGTYGIRYLFIPDPIFVFFINSGVIADINAYVDSGERLKIYNSLKGANLFQVKKFLYTDYSGILFFFGSLLAALYCIDSFSQQKYLKLLASVIKSSGRVFFYLLFTRLLILLGLLVVIIGGAILVIYFNGLPFFFNTHFFNFLLLLFLVTLYFFFLGAVFSTCRSRIHGLSTLLTCWFILVTIIPAGFHYYISQTSELMTSIYELEQKKLKLVMDFEKRAIDKNITYKYGEKLKPSVKEKVLEYFNNELKKINALEEQLRSKMRKYISHLQRLSLVFPSTFYISSNCEISSTGYQNIIEFYRYVQDSKQDFFKFFMDKIYFSENASNFAKIESFIDNDENVFQSQSRLPLLFVLGLVITSIHIFILILASYSRYKRFITTLCPKADYNKSPVDLHLQKEGLEVLECEDEIYMEFIYNTFAGKIVDGLHKGNPGKLVVNNRDITVEKSTYDSFYICHPDNFPLEVKARDFLLFLARLMKVPGSRVREIISTYSLNTVMSKRIKAFDKMKKGNLVLAILSMAASEVYLVEDAALKMPIKFAIRLKEKMEQKVEENALVLYITSTDQVFDRSAEKGPGIYKTKAWEQLVDHYKELYGTE